MRVRLHRQVFELPAIIDAKLVDRLHHAINHRLDDIAGAEIMTTDAAIALHLGVAQHQLVPGIGVGMIGVDIDPVERAVVEGRQHLGGTAQMQLHLPAGDLFREHALHPLMAFVIAVEIPWIDEMQRGGLVERHDLLRIIAKGHADFRHDATMRQPVQKLRAVGQQATVFRVMQGKHGARRAIFQRNPLFERKHEAKDSVLRSTYVTGVEDTRHHW